MKSHHFDLSLSNSSQAWTSYLPFPRNKKKEYDFSYKQYYYTYCAKRKCMRNALKLKSVPSFLTKKLLFIDDLGLTFCNKKKKKLIKKIPFTTFLISESKNTPHCAKKNTLLFTQHYKEYSTSIEEEILKYVWQLSYTTLIADLHCRSKKNPPA